MNLIERAGKRSGPAAAKSLIERVADQLGAAPAGTAPSPPPPGDPIPASAASGTEPASKRRTQRHIELDLNRLSAAGIAVPGDQSVVAEEFRLIKRPLLDIAFARSSAAPENGNLIMVTSAGPNEGKTFVATNLAISMASEHEVRVLLVDADVANPSVPRMLGFDAEVGLVDVVANPSIDLADVMIRTSIDDLTLLPAGRSAGAASELLASARMMHFINDVAKRYNDRVIIFDSPPVLARSEPTVLARHVGQIVFVVEAERTSRSALNNALRLIDSSKSVGLVFNKAPSSLLRDGFGQYYDHYSSRTRTGSN